jgi:hypothetical protein
MRGEVPIESKDLIPQIEHVNGWIRFVWSEYFKWYAAFLALNVAALVFRNQNDPITGAYQNYVVYIFLIINPVSIFLAASAYWWYYRRYSAIRILSIKVERTSLFQVEPPLASVPHLVFTFACVAICLTQLGFFIVWLRVLRG